MRKQKETTKIAEESGNKPDRPGRSRFGRESIAIVLLSMAIFLAICLLSYDQRDPSFNIATSRSNVSNLGGLVGSHIADVLVQVFGISSILIPCAMAFLALRIFVPNSNCLGPSQFISTAIIVIAVSGLVERFLPWHIKQLLPFPHPGGTLGLIAHSYSYMLLGSAGEMVFAITILFLCSLHLKKSLLLRIKMWATGVRRSIIQFFSFFPAKIQFFFARISSWGSVSPSFRPVTDTGTTLSVCDTSEQSRSITFPFTDVVRDQIDGPVMSECIHNSSEDNYCNSSGASFVEEVRGVMGGQKSFSGEIDDSDRIPWRPLHVSASKSYISQNSAPQVLKSNCTDLAVKSSTSVDLEVSGESIHERREEHSTITVTSRADENLLQHESSSDQTVQGEDYLFPPTELLDAPQVSNRLVDRNVLEANALVLQQKLADLGIKGEIVAIHPGPVITMYELALASGIPLRKVLNTSNDLAMALKSGSTRVVAPIPGKNTVGIEVPNHHREIVYFKEIVESPAFRNLAAPLKVALGKATDGEPFPTSLVRMPHLLIAGATGTGKSVGLNCLICSWLMTCHPDDVKFLMVDPKKLELSYYQDIPHLIHPVVTEAEKVPRVLSWAIREMERRYDLLSRTGAKNIEGYNGQVASGELAKNREDEVFEKLPYIVIIVDELAELMMVAAKDIEISIARLAQMARASGIHLILATQRPSVDVITGVIKANFPARISYQVSARPDSRTILDTTGAENLLGMGDMLFLPPGTAKLTRLHGAYVSENEIRRIADFVKSQRKPVYLKEITKHVTESDSKASVGDSIQDEKYDEAVELITRLGHASISLIQRHMRIGYNRAARIIEVMEAEGIIGPSDGTSRPREVLTRSLESIPDSP
jgi:DNA segregation ATPase FtsK/SpoIIIE-like protein